MNPSTKLLSLEIKGRGRVKGYVYRQLVKIPKAYLYEASHPDTDQVHYEVFKREVFEPDNREKYPSKKAQGIWAWCPRKKEDALKKWKIFLLSCIFLILSYCGY